MSSARVSYGGGDVCNPSVNRRNFSRRAIRILSHAPMAVFDCQGRGHVPFHPDVFVL